MSKNLLLIILNIVSCVVSASSTYEYNILSQLIKSSNPFKQHHDLSPEGNISRIGNDALVEYDNKTSDGYLTNYLELEFYRNLDDLFMAGNSSFFSLGCSYDEKLAVHCDEGDWYEHVQSGEAYQVRFSERYGHRLYTPETDLYKGIEYSNVREKISDPDEFDRPFMAWAYYARKLEFESIRERHTHEMSYGVVGDIAMGRPVQEWAHTYPFPGEDVDIEGWNTVAAQRASWQYHYAYERLFQRQFFNFNPIQYNPGLNFHFGNIIQSIGLSQTFGMGLWQQNAPLEICGYSIGKGAKYSYLSSKKGLDSDDYFVGIRKRHVLDVNLEFHLNYVRYNYLLQGGTHVDAGTYSEDELLLYEADKGDKPSINRKWVHGGTKHFKLVNIVPQVTASVTIFNTLSLSYNWQGKETQEQLHNHKWVELSTDFESELGAFTLVFFLGGNAATNT